MVGNCSSPSGPNNSSSSGNAGSKQLSKEESQENIELFRGQQDYVAVLLDQSKTLADFFTKAPEIISLMDKSERFVIARRTIHRLAELVQASTREDRDAMKSNQVFRS